MTYDEFEKLVKEGIESIDEKFLNRLKNVDIVIEDKPSNFQLEKIRLRGEVLLGLYEGVPLTQRQGYGQVLPDKITIFKDSIESIYSNPDEIKNAVKNTVWHEIAHHFGMNEQEVRAAEQNRKNKS